MVKEVEVEGFVPGLTAKQYFEIIYQGDKAGKAFHAKVNKDQNAKFSPWVEGTRKAEFSMPVNVPAMLKKMIGMDVIPVVETQKLQWRDPRTFTVSSDPQLNFPGANKFTTSGSITISDAPGGCKLKCVITVSAALAWPLQSTVEGIMGQEAIESIGTFINWCKEYCAQQLAAGAAAAAAEPVPERPAARAGSVVLGEDGEMFYDAADSEAGAAAAAEAGPLVPYQPPRLEDVIVGCLKQIQQSTQETATLLRSLQELMQGMHDDIHAVRSVVAPGRRGSGGGGGSSGRSTWLYLLGLGSLAAAGTAGYMRYKAHGRLL